MKEKTQKKSLLHVNEDSIFYKIKCFFKNLFLKKTFINNVSDTIETTEDIKQMTESKNVFKESIRNIEDEETKLLKLQKKYRRGEIKEEDLTDEQISSLCKLYDKQIADLRKSNQVRKQKLLEYRKKYELIFK